MRRRLCFLCFWTRAASDVLCFVGVGVLCTTSSLSILQKEENKLDIITS